MKLRPFLTRVLLGTVLLAPVLFPAAAAQAESPPTAAITPAAAETQRTIFAVNGIARKDQYIWPVLNQPLNYLTPANYREGKSYLRVVVSGKPSTKALWVHICMWRHRQGPGIPTIKFYWETCSSGSKAPITTNGTYYFDIGNFGSWWKKGGTWDYTKEASDIRPLLKDPITGKLMYTKSCATTCYQLPDIDTHVPFNLTIDFIMVSQGRTLTPPTSWTGCPTAWSTAC